jgi:hypothetical protein
MTDVRESEDNMLLASSCSKEQVACCKDGYIFLPRSEYQAIIKHLTSRPNDLQEFTSRIADHGDFLFYNQQTRCQFLRSDERCELHHLGIKPSECFWWPAHVYLADDGTLEIRVAKFSQKVLTSKRWRNKHGSLAYHSLKTFEPFIPTVEATEF